MALIGKLAQQKRMVRKILLAEMVFKMANQKAHMNKLDFSIRKNQGKRELNGYIESLSNILNINIKEDDFLSLEESDRLTELYFNNLKGIEKTLDKVVEEKDMNEIPFLIKQELNTAVLDKVYLISKQSERCGLAILPFQACLQNESIKKLIEYDGDNLCLMAINLTIGINIDYYSEYVSYIEKYYYQVSIWHAKPSII